MTFAEIAPRLFDNGWTTVMPLSADKGTHDPWRWMVWDGEGTAKPRLPTRDDLDYWIRRNPNATRTGMVFAPHLETPIVALDLDILDPKENLRARDIAKEMGLRSSFLRIGQSPKCMLFFRGKVKSTKMLGGEGGGIEVFGSSGQVVIYGIHPGTQKPYGWPQDGLLDHTPKDLPVAKQQQVSDWLAACKSQVTPRTSSGTATTWSDNAHLRELTQKYGLEGVAQILKETRNGERHINITWVTAHLISKGYEVQEIGDFVDRFFPQHLRTRPFHNIREYAKKQASYAEQNFFEDDYE